MTIAAGGLTGGMLASLPLAAYLAIFWVLRLRGEGWRSAALGAAVCWGVFLALVTEILSVPRLITRPALSVAWLSLALVVFACGWVLHGSTPRRDEAEGEDNQKSNARPLDKMDWLLLSGIGLLVALVGITAILSAPNTWDAMAYHMSRVAQWMTNRDVNFYPAFYSQQLYLSPLAEYTMLHLDVLYGGDRLVNLVEWLSMIGTILGTSLIAQRLGAGLRGQLFAALGCATIPVSVLEASGAKNNCVVAFWIVAAVYYLLRWNERQSWSCTFAIGSALGLAILTKGTAYVLLPAMMLALWWIGAAPARKLLLARLPVLLLIVLVLNGPIFVRNYGLSGSPLGFSSPYGDDPERQYSNSHLSVSITFANVVKSVALHVGTPSDAVNGRITRLIISALRSLGIDPNDKVSTWRGGFHLNGASANEGRAGNPLHLALIGISSFLFFSGRVGNRSLRLYMLGLLGSFVLFCALLRWTPWNSRYQISLFVLGMVVVGIVLEQSRPRFAVAGIALLLLVSAFPFALLNSLRPLAPWASRSILRKSRVESYFADSHDWWASSYVSAAKLVESSHCNSIGVDSSLEDFDYPVFALLDAGHGDRQVRYINVRNLTARYARPESTSPCAVICLRCANAPAKWAEYRLVGGRASVFDEVAVFSQKGEVPNDQTAILPQPSQTKAILEQLDHYRESPRAVNFAATESRVNRASRNWPKKEADLRARLNALYTGAVTLWRVRDSVELMRRKNEPMDYSKIDPTQVLAASEVFENWDQTIQTRVNDLNKLMDELYSSWETTMAVPPANGGNTGACRVGVQTVETQFTGPVSRIMTTPSDERSIDMPECSCLGKQSNLGPLLARKPFGVYDSEAENFTKCTTPSSMGVPPAWVPVRTARILDVAR